LIQIRDLNYEQRFKTGFNILSSTSKKSSEYRRKS